MPRYQVISLDVYGNTRDGFGINQSFETNRFIELEEPESASDRLINRRLGVHGVTWEGEPEHLRGSLKRNGMPALELKLTEEDK